MGYLYILTSPIGKSYIGQTIRPIEERFKEHQKKTSSCVAVSNAIQKYGWENFDKDWYECPDEELNKHEELMVEVLGTLVPNGYNLREGGGATGKLSEETRQKISEAHAGKIPSEQTRQKMSESKKGEKNPNYGKSPGEETKQKMSESQRGDKGYWYGKSIEEETRQKISESLLGKTRTDETKQKISESKKGEKNPMFGKTGENHNSSKRVYRYALNDTFIDSFGSCEEAGRHLKKNGRNIRACASGEKNHKTAYGFKWSYVKY
ncbi:GIY-YIG catalytic domain-containing endonuclease [Paramecium bursaria Chlorella virus NE-JV-4]|nr:GIY-YIG catalytic domain-containing endonuclease [Paramecium bursaria Chlorella virus NE-JV-4]